jgi:hypothetical protein
MNLENYKIIDIIRAATLATGEYWPDGKGRSRWQRFKGFFLKIWNLARYNALYNSKPVMTSVMWDGKLRELNTPVYIYAVGLTPAQTIVFTNDMEWENFDKTVLPQDCHVYGGDLDVATLAAFTSSIPIIFHVDTSDFGFKWLDGALASMAPWEHITDKNHMIVSVCDTLDRPLKIEIEHKTLKDTWPTKLPFFLGNIYSIWKGAQFLYSDKALDQMVAFLRAARKEVVHKCSSCNTEEVVIKGEIKKVLEVPTTELRSQVNDCPSWIDFAGHTDDVVDELFRVSYDWGKEYIREVYSDEEILEIAKHGTSIGITGGACLGYNQAPIIAAFWEIILDTQREHGLPIRKPFNSFSGNSVGAIQSMFFAWIQDMYYDADGRGQEKLCKMTEASSFRIQDFPEPS